MKSRTSDLYRYMTQQPLISVIIPVYNVSAYLDECVNSVIGQTYQNLEIILVDDGSPDDCPQKCDAYAAKDNRIKVIHQKNGGLSAARNAALDICQGEYISFVDSDDVVADDFIETLYKVLTENNVEIAICNNQIFSTALPVNKPNVGKVTVYDARQAVKRLLEAKPFGTSACDKLYAHRVFKDLRFPTGLIYEDLAAIWKTFAQVEKVAYVPTAKYYYRCNPSSITHAKFTHKNLDIIKSFQLVLDEIPNYFPDLIGCVRGRLGGSAASHIYSAWRCSFQDVKALKKLQIITKQNIKEILRSEFSIKVKLFSLVICNDFLFRQITKIARKTNRLS